MLLAIHCRLILRAFQTETLSALEQPGACVLRISPTGSGKGVILEAIGAIPTERLLIIVPLIALGRQLSSRLNRLDSAAHCFMGSPTSRPSGRERVWIVSPECLTGEGMLARVREWCPSTIAIDECHCIYEWGLGFRPAYLRLFHFLREFSTTRLLLLTATFPRDYVGRLKRDLGRPILIQGNFQLPPGLTLQFERIPWASRPIRLTEWVTPHCDGGIVFAATRAQTENLSRLLSCRGRKPWIYHAGLSNEERRTTELAIARVPAPVIVATSAFGLGMDYDRLAWAVLWQVPLTLLSLAQLVGRVGRAGRTGIAKLFWDEEDFRWNGFRSSDDPQKVQDLKTLRQFYESSHREAYLREYFL